MRQSEPPEPWYTKRELAAHLKVSPRTITRMRLPFTRVGGQNRYRLSEVELALAGKIPENTDNVVQLRPSRPDGAA